MGTETMGHEPLRCIIPDHMLDAIKARGNADQRRMAEAVETDGVRVRTRRLVASAGAFGAVPAAPAAAAGPKVEIYDARQSWDNLPGTKLTSEQIEADPAAKEAHDGAQDTYRLFLEEYERDSVDGAGRTLVSSVHVGEKTNNAFWDGSQMLYGDGDGILFNRFTISPSVIGHELAHGVVQYSGGLVYQDQAGALNEHVADVFGCLMEQWKQGQKAHEASWLIGDGLLGAQVNKGTALRSMRAPGTAYHDDVLGKDPQPFHMDEYVVTSSDHGGVHINSGIPNHAFFLVATLLGGEAWKAPGTIWYKTLQRFNNPHGTFAEWADLTVWIAAELYPNSDAALLVRRAWKLVGIAL